MTHSMSAVWEVLISEEETIEVTFFATPRQEDAGIGPYEFWGQKSYDSRPYVSCEHYGIDYDETLYSPEINKKILQWLEDNYDRIEEEFIRKFTE